MPTVTVIQPTIAEEKSRMIRCAAYCRVSSDSADQLNSFMAQLKYYENFLADSETETLVNVYADEGVTGTREDKREDFQRMMKLCNKLIYNYNHILFPLQSALQDLKLRRFSSNSNVMEIHKEIAKFKEQTHVLARLKTKGFLDNAKYLEQTSELNSKVSKLQSELKKITHLDDEDETLDQIEMLIDYFEKQGDPITEFDESAFEFLIEKIVVINQNKLEFHIIGGLKFTEKIC